MSNEFKLNDNQKKAVNFPHDMSAIVTAAAGSGKTTLLVQRIVRLLSDKSLNIPANSLAIMTFTKNATKNMREKLNKALSEKLEKLSGKTTSDEREQYDYLKKQLFALRRACISTIDAFCLRIIKENAEAFELPINFTIADSAKKAAMQTQAIKLAMQDFYGDSFSDKDRDALFFSFNFEDDNKLKDTILSVSEKLSSYPNPKQWEENAVDVYKFDNTKEIQPVEKFYLPLIANYLKLRIKIIKNNFDKYNNEHILDKINDEYRESVSDKDKLNTFDNEIFPTYENYIIYDKKRIETLCNDFEDFENNMSYSALNNFLSKYENYPDKPPYIEARKGNSKNIKSDARKRFTVLKNNVQKSIDEILKIKIDNDEEDNISNIQACIKSFVKLLDIYTQYYNAEKITSGCIDFSDCERLLYDKLSENNGDNEFRKQLSQRFKCIIVDEFQDSNDIQAEIFNLLGKGHLFYVGDVKQSIYSFRGADPYIMADLCDTKKDSGFKVLPLNTNYRSRKAVIDTVNAAFNGLMTKQYGGVDYSDGNELNLGCDLPEPQNKELYNSEIVLIKNTSNSDNDDDNSMICPRYVANKIKALHDDENFLISDGKDDNDNYKFRRAEYSDFIILLRTNNKISNYRQALAELGISSSAPKGRNFFNSDEILLVYNYLKVIDNPLLDEEMLKVLMSPIYRFNAEEIAQLKMGILGIDNLDEKELDKISKEYKRYSLYSCIKACTKQSEDKIHRTVPQKLQRFYDDLKSFRYYMNSNSLDNLIRKIYEGTDLISVVSAFEDSNGRVENIRRLQQLAADYEARGGGNLSDFLRFIDRAKENSDKSIEEATRPESGANAVRIMTFHGCKGLEAPVCIMSELQNKMNPADYSGDILIDREHYIAMKNTNIKNRRKTTTMPYIALSQFIKERQLGDELRLLYVAMTRAQEKLIMVSNIGKKNYDNFSSYVDENKIDPNANENVYTNSVPFNCILSTLFQYAPTVEDEAKQFTLKDIDCTVSAIDLSENNSIEENVSGTDLSDNDICDEISEKEITEISDTIKQEYNHIFATEQQAKFTATELAHKNDNDKLYFDTPYFIEGNKISGADKGNAYHHCMQHFPLDCVNADMDYEDILHCVENAIDKMTESKKITAVERDIIEPERVAKFFYGEIGKRMLNAFNQNSDNVKREQSFYAEVNGQDVRQKYDGDISIQGQIDMYFIENGEIIVVDYKSDTIENLAKEQKNYEFQVEIYTKVLGKLTGMNIKEMYLYSFMENKEIKI